MVAVEVGVVAGDAHEDLGVVAAVAAVVAVEARAGAD